jgi:hypothetical protein
MAIVDSTTADCGTSEVWNRLGHVCREVVEMEKRDL